MRRHGRARRVGSILLGVLSALGALPLLAQAPSDRAWVPQAAESLQELSDAVERARSERDLRQEREALLRLAERLLDEVPDGGFAIGGGRWIGPGAYLTAAAAELEEAERRRFTEEIDLLVAARLDRDPERAPVERWLRDLPVSGRFDRVRGELTAALLESGDAERWLARVEAGWPRGAEIEPSAVARWLARPPPAEAPLAHPWSPEISAHWPVPGDPRSPWRPGAIRIEPVVSGDLVWIATPDGVHCWQSARAAELWFFPFVADGPPILPGTVRTPALAGRTLVVTTELGALGLDRDTGTVKFSLDGKSLFPAPEGATATADEPDRGDGSPILAISPPARTARGAVFAASRVVAGSLDLRLVHIDPEGRILWNRDVGSAAGATHLALGSVLPAPVPHGDEVTVLTQRGCLSTHSLLDGGLLWAAPYPGFAASASRDAIRHSARPRDARLEADERHLYLTSLDTAALQVWGRESGSPIAEIPLGTARWWALAPRTGESRRLLLVAPERVTEWELGSAGPRAISTAAPEPGLPLFSGPPLFVGDGWWVPHEGGVYRLDSAGRIDEVVDLSPPGAVRGIGRAGAGLIILGDGFAELRLPAEPRPGTLASLWREIARGDLRALPDPLPVADRVASEEIRTEEERAARTLLWQLRRPGLPPELRARIAPVAVGRIVRSAERARTALRESVAAVDREEGALAVELAWLAIAEEDPSLPVEIPPLGSIPLELAVRQVLSRLRDAEERLPGQDRLERRAREHLARGGVGNRLDRRLETFQRCPGTSVGRRAALDAAEELYRYGNLGRSLELLERLLLYEPRNAEAVEARFRVAELAREIGHIDRAAELLDELARDYGDLSLTVTTEGVNRDVTVRERVDSLRKTLPAPERTPRAVVALPLLPAWRTRTELEHLRSLIVHPLEDGSGRYLTISRRSIELREAQRGDRLWHRTLLPLPDAESVPTWSDIGRLAAPIAVDAESIWITDRRQLLRLSIADGETLWSRELPVPVGADHPEGGAEEAAPNPIEQSALGGGAIIAQGGDGEIHAFDAATGEPLWHRPAPGPLEGPMQVRDGRLLLGISAPPRVELWSLADGAPLWSYDVESLGTTLAQEPRFAPERAVTEGGRPAAEPSDGDRHVIVALERGEILRIDPATGETIWSHGAPSILWRVHRPEGFPFWIAEHYWTAEAPSLYGIDPESGRVLWQKTFPVEQRPLHEVVGYDGDLYLVEGDFNQRRVLCLEVPRGFPRQDSDPAARELRTRWQSRLTQSWDVPRLRAHQDWLLLEDSMNCDLAILSRETGIPIPAREGFESVEAFLRGRQRLHFAGFVDETLLLVTARGALGLRAPQPIRERAELWSRLEELPLGGSDEPSRRPVSDAIRAFRAGQGAAAVAVIERAVEEPGLEPERRRSLLYRLEGFAEDLGEESSAEWRVPRLETPPVVDGSLEEAWNAATAWPVESARSFHPIQGLGEDAAQWRGPRDLSLVVLAAWSDVGFHLALDVSDDSIHPYDRELEYWNGDCLLLAFDFLGDGGNLPDGDDQLLTLALTVPRRPPPGGAGAPGGAAGGGAGAQPPPKEEDPPGEYQVQRKGDGSGVVYEVMLPWKSFREAREQEAIPHPGMTFRLNLVLTDDDGGQGATTYMSLSPGQLLREETRSVWNIFIPDRFPRITLGR